MRPPFESSTALKGRVRSAQGAHQTHVEAAAPDSDADTTAAACRHSEKNGPHDDGELRRRGGDI
eukprot:6547558-Pyramimonas_sp.AAC.1